MAVYKTEEAPPIEYENHPVGTGFTGVITEVAINKKTPTAEYPNNDGTLTRHINVCWLSPIHLDIPRHIQMPTV